MTTTLLRTAWLLLAVVVGSSCQRKVIRLTEQGRYEQAVQRAESLRFGTHGKAARAYAEALVATGREDKALAVLLKDFRSGSNLESLVALADLEHALGRRGTAALHYERALQIDHSLIEERDDVCVLLLDRARALLHGRQGLAAEETLARANRVCGAPRRASERVSLQALARDIDEVADAQVDRRIALNECGQEDCAEQARATWVAQQRRQLEEAAQSGPRALWLEAGRQQAQVPPTELAEILVAEARGELGDAPLLDEGVAMLVGAQTWTDLAPTVMSLTQPRAAWVQLRLAPVVQEMPVAPAPRIGPDQHDRWSDRVEQIDGVQSWRVQVFRGDLVEAELDLSARLRPAPAAVEPAAEPTEAGAPAEPSSPGPVDPATETGVPREEAVGPVVSVEAPDHWLARAPIDAQRLPQLLAVARLRRAAGFEDLGLRATRHLLARAHAQGLDTAVRWALVETARALAWGRFWEAKAIADAIGSDAVEPARAAAANAIRMAEIFCEGPCTDDADAALVQRVMGESWMAATRGELERLARSGGERGDPGRRRGCPTMAELLAPDAVGPVPEALALARRDLDAPGVGDALVSALEAEPALICAPPVLVPLLIAGGHELSAQRLAEVLAHTPQMRSSLELHAHAELAMVAREPVRAELLAAAAAAASGQPQRTWLSLARSAAATGLRDLELLALRQVLLHSPDLEHPGVRSAILLHGLRDAQRAWSDDRAAADALSRHVELHLQRFPASQRSAIRQALAARIARAGWLRPEAVPAVVDALFPTPDLQRQHATVIAALRAEAPPPPRSVLDVEGWAASARAGKLDAVPGVIELFADPSRAEPLRLALAQHARPWSLRWRSAIGLMTFGSPASRLRAAEVLMRMTGDDPERARALGDWWARAPAVLEAHGQHNPRDVVASSLAADARSLLSLVFGLDLAPWLVGY